MHVDAINVPGLDRALLRPQQDAAEWIVANLAREVGVRAVFLTGSLAAGAGDAHSDVDLLVHIDPWKRGDLWGRWQRIVPRPNAPILD